MAAQARVAAHMSLFFEIKPLAVKRYAWRTFTLAGACRKISSNGAIAMKAIGLRRWSRDEYDGMIAAGLFGPDEHVELIDGEILAVTPHGTLHATAIRLAEEALRAAFGPGFDVRSQLPLACRPDSEPQPDIAVVSGTPRIYRDAHPTSALLVVEVSDSTLEHDRDRKGRLYARAGTQEYWIINLNDRCVEVYRHPDETSYRTSLRFMPGECIHPLAASATEVAVSDLLP
jgi:Uma2 family endonuclease